MFRRDRGKRDPGGIPLDHAGEELRNQALIDAMRAVSVNDTSASRAMLFQLMIESTLVVMSPTSPPEPASWTARTGDTLQFVTLTDDDGTVLPVFTSTAALLRFRPEGAGYVALPGSAIFEMADRAGTNKVVFDMGSPTTGFVTRAEIEALARGRLPLGGGSEVVAAETAIRVGRPAVAPSPDLLDAVRSTLSESAGVTRAWLTMIQHGESRPETVIAIRLGPTADETSMRRIVDTVGARSGPAAAELRFLGVDDSWQQTLDSGAGEVIYTAPT